MIEIESPRSIIETPGDGPYGKYVVEPLERGYGTTWAIALRRILLSSLPAPQPPASKLPVCSMSSPPSPA